MPDWLASKTTIPGPVVVMRLLAMVAGPDRTFTVTVSPELASGTFNAKEVFFFWSAMFENLAIVWLPMFTWKEVVTCGAAE